MCGSRMNESACSSPSYFGRSERAKMPDPPYAPSTWNHQPRSCAIAPTPARSSMIPAFVVPEVHTTAAMSDAFSGTASRTVSAVSRWSGVSTTSASISSNRSVFTIDEWASDPTTTRSRPVGTRVLAVSRATARADRLPAEPPDTKHPPAVAGSPASRAITSARCSRRQSRRTLPARRCPESRRRTPACRTAGSPWSARPG